MTKERIRILVDTSRDTGWSNGLIRIEPDSIYRTTNNRDYLSRGEVTSPLQELRCIDDLQQHTPKIYRCGAPTYPRVCRKWRWTAFSRQYEPI